MQALSSFCSLVSKFWNPDVPAAAAEPVASEPVAPSAASVELQTLPFTPFAVYDVLWRPRSYRDYDKSADTKTSEVKLRELDAYLKEKFSGHLFHLDMRENKLYTGYRSQDLKECVSDIERIFTITLLETALDTTTVIRELTQKAELRFQGFQPVPTVHSLEASFSFEQMINHLLIEMNYEGVFIGQFNHHISPKKALLESLPFLKSMGVDTIFIEGLLYDCLQPLLDASPQSSSPILANFLKSMDFLPKIFNDGRKRSLYEQFCYQHLITTLKKEGFRVVGLDTNSSFLTGRTNRYTHQRRERYTCFNVTAEEIIRREKRGKFVALMGEGHGATTLEIPGVAELLGCPLLMIEDAPIGEKAETKINVANFEIDHEDSKDVVRHLDAHIRIKM